MKSKEDKILIKNTVTRKEVWYEEIACGVPQQTLATTLTVKRLQRKIDDTVERSTDNLPVEEIEKMLLNKNIV